MGKTVEDNNTAGTDMANTALQRSNIYSFFSLIYMKEVTGKFLHPIKESELLSVLIEMGAAFDFEDDFIHLSDNQLIEDLAVEFARLFLGPGKHISPHESVHHRRDDGDWGQLWGADTVAVKKFIESTGLEYTTEFSGLPDHIGVELEFMSEVIKREAAAWQENDREGARYCLKIEKRFLEEHLAAWAPEFCDRVIEHAELSFYREIAKLTKSFLDTEKEEIGDFLIKAE